MMNSNVDELIDIKTLADALIAKFESLHPISEECCISGIPQRLRQLNKSVCTPRAVSIGPFHYGREDFKAMEEHKISFLRDFLVRTQVGIEDFLMYVKDREVELRECYTEIINLGSDEFVKMMLVDAAFVIEVFLKNRIPIICNSAEVSYSMNMNIEIWPDIWKLENQLPLFILKGLYDLAMSSPSTEHYMGFSMCNLALHTLSIRRVPEYLFRIEEELVEIYFSEAKHLLDWLRLCLQPPELGAQTKCESLSIPTLTELEQAGVKIKLDSSKHLFDIRFKNGVLEIPKFLTLTDSSECFYINLMALEQLHSDTSYLNDYITFISLLVKTRKDEIILLQNGVTENFLWDREGGTSLFHKLGNQCFISSTEFYYSDLAQQLNTYSRTRWYKWKANLKQNYFNSPWASISVVAAVILLVLTFIQTICSVIGL